MEEENIIRDRFRNIMRMYIYMTSLMLIIIILALVVVLVLGCYYPSPQHIREHCILKYGGEGPIIEGTVNYYMYAHTIMPCNECVKYTGRMSIDDKIPSYRFEVTGWTMFRNAIKRTAYVKIGNVYIIKGPDFIMCSDDDADYVEKHQGIKIKDK